MIDFLIAQQDYLRFFYGMSMIVLMAACLVVKRTEEDFIPWYHLALYGFLFGIHELLLIISPLLDTSVRFDDILDFLLLFASYLALLEFGRLGLVRLTEKTPGRWIYIPLLAGIVIGGFAAGWKDVLVTSRNIITLPGRMLAAAIFLFFAFRKKSLPRLLLMIIGLLMALSAAASNIASYIDGLIIAAGGISAPLGGELSAPLIKGLLIIAIAFVVSLYSQTYFQGVGSFRYFKKRSRHLLGFSILVIVFIFFAGWKVTQSFGNSAGRNIESDYQSLADILERQITSLTDAADLEAKALAESSEAQAALSSGGSALKRASVILKNVKWLHREEICYLLNNRGKVIAASDDDKQDGIVGQDFSRHPYAARALSGSPASSIAFGFASDRRGYFSAYPVFNDKIEVIGAAVIKKSLDALEKDFADHRGIVVLATHEGIVLLSSRPKMALMNLWPPAGKIRWDDIVSGYGSARRTDPVFHSEPDNRQYISFEGKRYIAITEDMVKHGWTIFLMSPTDRIVFYRLFGIMIAASLCFLTIVFFVGMEKSMETAAHIALSENRFHVLFEGAPAAIFMASKAGKHILSVNSFMTKWLGYGKDELLALTLDDIRVGEGEAKGECLYRKQDGAVAYVEEVREEMPFRGQAAELIIVHDISERKRRAESLYELSMSDGLTGIANRRRFDQFLDQEWRRAMREGTPVSLILCDIDFFKPYNDTYGHLAGDDCLRQVADLLASALHRPGDMVARYGGEEFAVIMPGTDIQGALSVAEATRKRAIALAIRHDASPAGPVVTLSMGVAAVVPIQGDSDSILIAAADNALYRAKSEGRNCVRS